MSGELEKSSWTRAELEGEIGLEERRWLGACQL